jgi:1-acyl-sn-glycerol-3-phosphate acyltransferase
MTRLKNYLRLIYRTLLITLSLFVSTLLIRKNDNGPTVAYKWAKWLTKHSDVKINVYGRVPTKTPILYVANHKSYIEGIAILAQAPLTFLGKAEVRYWPIIGLGAAAIGTVFVQRDNKESRRNAAKAIKERLLEGKSVLVFPEGTTYAGHTVQKFFPGSFYVSSETGIPIVPVAVRFRDDTISFTEELFLMNFIRVFSKKEIVIDLHFGPEMTDTDPVKLCNNAHDWIQKSLDS